MAERVIYRGETYWLQTTGRYFQSGDKTAPERLLHRSVWIDHKGAIPPGFAVHHIDGNWRNNAIENLELLPSSEHHRMHMLERWQEPKHAARLREGLKKAREAAKDWHASPEGLEWHSKNGKAMWEGRGRVLSLAECLHCKGEILTFFPSRTKFCSRNCERNHDYRKNFTSERVCAHCGAAFTANKYRKTTYCSRTCSNRARVV